MLVQTKKKAIQFKPHKYQSAAIEHIMDNLRSGLFLDMGLGKTVSTLTAISQLFDCLETAKVLVIAPKLVAEQTWPAEIQKWEHTKHLSVSPIIGTPNQRIRALKKEANIYTLGRDNVVWLVETLGRGGWDFDFLVIDESSSFKNPASMRFKALKKVAYLSDRLVLLTGTPAPNSLMDVWSQIYLIDQGERLGKFITQYREAYFIKNYNGFGYTLNPKYEATIQAKIKDVCISMTAEDYLDLPERVDNVQGLKLKNMDKYAEFKKQEVLKLEESGTEITPMNAAGLYSKLLQFSNGAVYDEEKNMHVVDNTKLDMLETLVEELNGEPVLIFYSFQSDKDRILKRIKGSVEMPKKDGALMVDRWNAKEVPILLAHPASIGHGLNMQYGGHNMIWFGLPWSLELYQQSIKRLDRQGQTKTVMNTMLIGEGTVEELVLERLGQKTETQNGLIEALKKYLY